MSNDDLALVESLAKIEDLSALQNFLESQLDILPLANTTAELVHGEGTADASVMLIGEAPGYHESVARRPFIGRSGQLLRKVLTEIGLKPETVYISNIVKVRPPDNRDPLPMEIVAFKPFLDREIELVNPELIVTLGRFSMAKFLPEVKISQVHGRLHKVQWQGREIFILPMYHPAAALRSTRTKEAFVKDFEKINKIIAWVKSQQETLALKAQLKEVLF